MRFYDCVAGQVLVDGVDVKTVDPKDLRARIAPVPQEASIFGASVAENIAYGQTEVDEGQSKKPPAVRRRTGSSASSTTAMRPSSASAA